MHKKIISIALLLFISSSCLYSMEPAEKAVALPRLNQGTLHLLEAIKEHDHKKALDAIKSEQADVNFHLQITDNDFSKTDWSPLMKAVAEMCYLMVTCQSRLCGAWSWSRASIKKEYEKDISEVEKIINLLIEASPSTKGYTSSKNISASSICAATQNLLSAPTLIPPYKNIGADASYIRLLAEIQAKLQQHKSGDSLSTKMRLIPGYMLQKKFDQVSFCEKLPIVFDPEYDISAYAIEMLHPFDAKKYGKVAGIVQQDLQVTLQQFHQPKPVSNEDLALAHTHSYIGSLANSSTLGILADMDSLGYLPNSFVQKVLLNPVKLATGGTIAATQLAEKYGWAINISGGYHHAKSQELVRGFCIINDLIIAARRILLANPIATILLVDLDAHQGNGHEEMAAVLGTSEENDWRNRIAIFDMYNADTWPGDYPCQERINFEFPLAAKTADAEYLRILITELPKAIDAAQPTHILYNAGTDIYEEDPLGMLSITREAIIKRDEFVFSQAMARKIPVTMVLSGGYHSQSYSIIGESIKNLWQKMLVHTVTKE